MASRSRSLRSRLMESALLTMSGAYLGLFSSLMQVMASAVSLLEKYSSISSSVFDSSSSSVNAFTALLSVSSDFDDVAEVAGAGTGTPVPLLASDADAVGEL